MVLVVPALAQPAPNARPTGGQVVAGSAAIAQAPNLTTISQASQRAAINWKTFDVGSKQTVRFAQPSASASTLNRVTTPNPSQIAGRITANGQVVIVNQSGVMFYKGAQVDVNGLVVSAAGITNKNYMAGRMIFDQPARPNARVVNAGTITINQAGLGALVAPEVANKGVIVAKLGHVVLAGAKTATLDMYGDGLLSIDVNGEVTQAPVGPNGKTATALVTNSGTILANGGKVLLTARAADGIVDNLVDAGGTIAADTEGGKAGMIALQGVGGDVVVSGALLARGQGAGQHGGSVVVNGDQGVQLASTARVDASGAAGGGVVAVGTTLKRAKGGPSVTAKRTVKAATIEAGATIRADATDAGDGGRVTVLSTEDTDFSGAISARGGPNGGDGGFAEISGGGGYQLNSDNVDLSAPHGTLGSLLLDPNNLDVEATGSSGVTVPATGTIASNSNAGTIGADTIAAIGADANVTLQAAGTIDVETNVTVDNSLSMLAGTGLTVGSGFTIVAGYTLDSAVLGLSAGNGLLQL
ncbi:MAG: filamentous hemagglutinin N-terminal domain-containing protein, partial [Acetobacteraceae bacterium]